MKEEGLRGKEFQGQRWRWWKYVTGSSQGNKASICVWLETSTMEAPYKQYGTLCHAVRKESSRGSHWRPNRWGLGSICFSSKTWRMGRIEGEKMPIETNGRGQGSKVRQIGLLNTGGSHCHVWRSLLSSGGELHALHPLMLTACETLSFTSSLREQRAMYDLLFSLKYWKLAIFTINLSPSVTLKRTTQNWVPL